tara:strand:- start:28347 stop:28922 length:576 start_codon:yes stop_codon:yes gene_type:complete
MSRIAIDIDEVLCRFVTSMATHNKLQLPKERRYSYIYKDMFNISHDQSVKMVNEFYNSDTFKNMEPIPGSRSIIRMLKPQAERLVIVTGRQRHARQVTEDWITENFPGMFDDMVFTDSFTINEISKVDVCKKLNIDTIIDDNDYQCDLCEHEGIRTFRFGGFNGVDMYPWCDRRNNTVLSWAELYRDNYIN